MFAVRQRFNAVRPFICVILLLLVASPVVAQQSLRVAVPALPTTFDPHQAVTSAQHFYAKALFLGLTTVDENGQVAPGLAESWVISPDGLRYEFTLRDDLVWSDGQRLKADDIAQSIARALDPATAAPFAGLLLKIENAEAFRLGTLLANQKLGVRARGQRTLEIHLAAPSQTFLRVLAQPVAMPVPLHRIKASPTGWATPETMVGNGPYRLAENGNQLVRNTAFIERTAKDPAEIEVVTEVQDGDVVLGFAPQPHTTGPQDVYRLLINVSGDILRQREVRHALGMVIDRADLIKALKIPKATPAYSLVPSPPYAPQQAPFAWLSESDRLIVAEALLLDLDQTQLPPLRFIHPAEPFSAAIADGTAKSWRALGFKTELIPLPFALYEKTVLAGDFDVAVATPAWWHTGLGLESFLFPHSVAAGPWNVGRYREAAFEDALIAADAALEPDVYREHLRRAEGVLIEDQAVWPLFFYQRGAP